MRACGGAVAGIAEAVAMVEAGDGRTSEGPMDDVASNSSYIVCSHSMLCFSSHQQGAYGGATEHNRGDDGFLFAEDGNFSHGPAVRAGRWTGCVCWYGDWSARALGPHTHDDSA